MTSAEEKHVGPLDCRTEAGVTVGLVDALITISRVLAGRDLSPQPVREALEDLRQDECVRTLFMSTLVGRRASGG